MFQRILWPLGVLLAALLFAPSFPAQQPAITLPSGSAQPTVRVRTSPTTDAPDDPLAPRALPAAPRATPLAWQWGFQRFVNLGTAEPASLQETVRVAFVNRGSSSVRVTYRAKLPSGFPAGSFRGLKEISYSMERLYTRVVRRGGRYLAESAGPFKLVESDPPGYTLADFSTLGGIARGRNMVAVVDEAFHGENLFVLNGDSLSFVNAHFADNSAHAFPGEITLEPVTGRSSAEASFPAK